MKVSILLSLYRCEKYIERYLEDAINQKGINDIEFSIIHNKPTDIEKEIINKFNNKLNIVYQEVERESLYKSWNKAIEQSTGEYLACWNVDDLRTPDSIIKMIETLDKNPEVGFTYGDIIIVNKFGSRKGEYLKTPEYRFEKGTTGAIGGPFFMWRKSLINKIGYFDEQFLSGGDFDYTVRLSILSQGKKTEGLLGYFLNDNSGLSTNNFKLQIIEREVIQRRYGIWYKTNLFLKSKLKKYDLNSFYAFDKKRQLDEEILELLKKRTSWKKFIIPSTLKYIIINFLIKTKRLIS